MLTKKELEQLIVAKDNNEVLAFLAKFYHLSQEDPASDNPEDSSRKRKAEA